MITTLPEELKLVAALPAAADAAGRTGQVISLKNANKAWVSCNIAQGNAATVTLSVVQAQSIGGATKALANAVPIWANEDISASDTLTRQTDAVNYTTGTTVKNKVVVFQIDPTKLDINNGYDCIAIQTGASNVANITAAMYVLDMKYKEASNPTAIAD
jgi:hypothetical protein